jgi:hypothetical protein
VEDKHFSSINRIKLVAEFDKIKLQLEKQIYSINRIEIVAEFKWIKSVNGK